MTRIANNTESLPPCPLCTSEVVAFVEGKRWARCPSCQAMVFPEADGPKVLIAHSSEETSSIVGSTLLDAGFCPLRAENGVEAIRILKTLRPAALVLDVALEKILSFQLIDRMRNDPELHPTKIILVASVFNKTAYKCKPTSLYGADEYVEIHHLQDKLPSLLKVLLGLSNTKAVDSRTHATPLAEPHRPEQTVSQLAKSIVTDIAMYHQASIDSILAGSDVDVMAPVLVEGRRLLLQQTGTSPIEGDPILEAFLDMIEELRNRNTSP